MPLFRPSRSRGGGTCMLGGAGPRPNLPMPFRAGVGATTDADRAFPTRLRAPTEPGPSPPAELGRSDIRVGVVPCDLPELPGGPRALGAGAAAPIGASPSDSSLWGSSPAMEQSSSGAPASPILLAGTGTSPPSCAGGAVCTATDGPPPPSEPETGPEVRAPGEGRWFSCEARGTGLRP